MRILGLGLAVALMAGALAGVAQENKSSRGYQDVGPERFDKLRSRKDAVVLDVRRPSEFAQGHIAGATNIDWYAPDFAKQAAALDKSKTYLVHCAGGVRSAKAAEKLAGMQFTNVFNLEGGFKAWQSAGKPVKKGP